MNKIASLIILTLLSCLFANAAEINHNVQGRVADKITGDPIPAKVFLMDAGGTILATTKATIENVPYQGQIALYVFNGKRLQKGKYIIKASMLGYKDAYENITLQSQRQTTLIANPILMEHDVHEPQGVTVKATKIKMVMHGDTIVYNADAFNLAEGSMLDALVARLPGAVDKGRTDIRQRAARQESAGQRTGFLQRQSEDGTGESAFLYREQDKGL